MCRSRSAPREGSGSLITGPQRQWPVECPAPPAHGPGEGRWVAHPGEAEGAGPRRGEAEPRRTSPRLRDTTERRHRAWQRNLLA